MFSLQNVIEFFYVNNKCNKIAFIKGDYVKMDSPLKKILNIVKLLHVIMQILNRK